MAGGFDSIPSWFKSILRKAGLLNQIDWLDLSQYTGAFPPGVGAPTLTDPSTPWAASLPDTIGQQAIYNGELYVQTAADASLQASWELGTADNANEVLYDNSGSGLAAVQVQAAVDELDGRIDTLEAVVIPYDLVVAASDETTDLDTLANPRITFRATRAFTLTGVEASVTTAPVFTTTGLEVDVLRNAATLLTGDIAFTTGSETAVGTISGGTVAVSAGDEFTVDINNVGDTTPGAGLKIYLIGNV
jgi:hypothetical protein